MTRFEPFCVPLFFHVIFKIVCFDRMAAILLFIGQQGLGRGPKLLGRSLLGCITWMQNMGEGHAPPQLIWHYLQAVLTNKKLDGNHLIMPYTDRLFEQKKYTLLKTSTSSNKRSLVRTTEKQKQCMLEFSPSVHINTFYCHYMYNWKALQCIISSLAWHSYSLPRAQ